MKNDLLTGLWEDKPCEAPKKTRTGGVRPVLAPGESATVAG